MDLVQHSEMLAGDGWWDRGYRCVDWHNEYGTWYVSGTKDGHTFDITAETREASHVRAVNEITKLEAQRIAMGS